MFKIELFEETGPAVNGRGTINPTWELDLGPTPTTNDFLDRGLHSQITTPGTYNYSYERYIFARITCTNPEDYQRIKEVHWYFENNIVQNEVTFPQRPVNYALLYKHTNVYAQPTNTLGSGKSVLSYGSGNAMLTVNTSLTSPDTATSNVNPQDGAALYTDYLVIQSRNGYVTPLPPTNGQITRINTPELLVNLLIIETQKD